MLTEIIKKAHAKVRFIKEKKILQGAWKKFPWMNIFGVEYWIKIEVTVLKEKKNQFITNKIHIYISEYL